MLHMMTYENKTVGTVNVEGNINHVIMKKMYVDE